MTTRYLYGKPTHDAVRHDVPMRRWTILAQDPDTTDKGGDALTTTVMIPAERLKRGPKGHRVHVIDYDASADLLYSAREQDGETDPYVGVRDTEKLVRDPYFHQQNVYAIAMATLQDSALECVRDRDPTERYRASHPRGVRPTRRRG